MVIGIHPSSPNDQKVPVDAQIDPIYNRYMSDPHTDHQQPRQSIAAQSLPATQYHAVTQSRMDVMARLNTEVPKNDYGLPILVYNPTHIPADFFSRDLNDQQDIISFAAVPVDYSEGFPTIDGTMMWEQMEFEPIESAQALSLYIKLEETAGYRSLALLAGELIPSNTPDASKKRDERLKTLREFFVYYSWGIRVKAYDMLHHVAYSRRRERRAMEIEDYHYIQLEKIMGKVIARFSRYTEDDWNLLEPGEASRILKDLAQMQRVAAGLPAHGPQQANAVSERMAGASIEQRLKEVAQRHATSTPAQSTVSETEAALRDDPQVLAMAQELIVTMAKKTQPTTNASSPRESDSDGTGDYDPNVDPDLDNGGRE